MALIFLNNMIPISKPEISQADKDSIIKAVDSGWVSSLGPEIRGFEEEFSSYIGVKHCVACSNGTTAIQLALSALGIGPEDEVIMPNLTFAAVSNAILAIGATPVFVDVDYGTWNIDIKNLANAITNKTKALIIVHSYGMPANIFEIKKQFPDLDLIEDCAEAHGAELNGVRVGSIGKLATFSFYANKIITTGEGGCVLTNSDNLKTKLIVLRDHGMSPTEKFSHIMPGFNYRMTNIQGALGRSQLNSIQKFIEMRHEQEYLYDSRLLRLGFRGSARLESSKNVNWLYTRLLPDRINTYDFMNYLKNEGIETRPMFRPINQFEYIKKIQKKYTDCGNSIKLSQKGISFPTYNGLKPKEIGYICEVIERFLLEK